MKLLFLVSARPSAWDALPATSGQRMVNRLLRLTLLAPDIQAAILEGWQPKDMQLEELTRAMPKAWEEQRQSCFRF